MRPLALRGRRLAARRQREPARRAGEVDAGRLVRDPDD